MPEQHHPADPSPQAPGPSAGPVATRGPSSPPDPLPAPTTAFSAEAGDAPRLRFPRTQRLQHNLQFRAVFDAKCAKPAHPLIVHGRPNDRNFNRLGLSVNRRVGSAVVRNRAKRVVREAFRLTQHELPQGYDLVVVVRRLADEEDTKKRVAGTDHNRPRATPGLDTHRCAELLRLAVTQIDREWQRRRSRRGANHGPAAGSHGRGRSGGHRGPHGAASKHPREQGGAAARTPPAVD